MADTTTTPSGTTPVDNGGDNGTIWTTIAENGGDWLTGIAQVWSASNGGSVPNGGSGGTTTNGGGTNTRQSLMKNPLVILIVIALICIALWFLFKKK